MRPDKLKGYDNDGVSEVSKALMQDVPLWDYPVRSTASSTPAATSA